MQIKYMLFVLYNRRKDWLISLFTIFENLI